MVMKAQFWSNIQENIQTLSQKYKEVEDTLGKKTTNQVIKYHSTRIFKNELHMTFLMRFLCSLK